MTTVAINELKILRNIRNYSTLLSVTNRKAKNLVSRAYACSEIPNRRIIMEKSFFLTTRRSSFPHRVTRLITKRKPPVLPRSHHGLGVQAHAAPTTWQTSASQTFPALNLHSIFIFAVYTCIRCLSVWKYSSCNGHRAFYSRNLLLARVIPRTANVYENRSIGPIDVFAIINRPLAILSICKILRSFYRIFNLR